MFLGAIRRNVAHVEGWRAFLRRGSDNTSKQNRCWYFFHWHLAFIWILANKTPWGWRKDICGSKLCLLNRSKKAFWFVLRLFLLQKVPRSKNDFWLQIFACGIADLIALWKAQGSLQSCCDKTARLPHRNTKRKQLRCSCSNPKTSLWRRPIGHRGTMGYTAQGWLGWRLPWACSRRCWV